MPSIEPTQQATEALASLSIEGPVVMINLLRFREQASYPAGSGDEPCSGREAYGRYGAGVLPLIGKAEARVVWAGSCQFTLIAPEGEAWDEAVLVEYPSRQAFLDMVASDDYRAISHHRTAGLSDSRLIVTRASTS